MATEKDQPVAFDQPVRDGQRYGVKGAKLIANPGPGSMSRAANSKAAAQAAKTPANADAASTAAASKTGAEADADAQAAASSGGTVKTEAGGATSGTKPAKAANS